MHNHIHIFGIEVPVCLEDIKVAAAVIPFWSYYVVLAKATMRSLWSKLRFNRSKA